MRLPGGDDLGGAAIRPSTQGEDNGVERRFLVGRCRTLWSATESRYLLTSGDGLWSCWRLVVWESLVARETTVRSYSALASPGGWDPRSAVTWMSLP